MVSQQVASTLKDTQVQAAILEAARSLWEAGRTPKEIDSPGFRDDLVSLKLKRAARETGLVVIRGYLEPSPDNSDSTGGSYLRVYASLTLSDYIDIPPDAVVLKVDLRSAFDRLAGQAVWVKLDADIVRGRLSVQKQLLQVDMLGGDIASGGGSRGGGGYSPSPWCGGGTRGGGGYSPSPWCGGGYSPSPWCGG